jgi:TfoX/Sxy family transcriptional regulator of competence genes
MAYDEALAARVRSLVSSRPNVAEIKMFGGVCFTLNGNMFAGINKDDFMAHLDKADHETALARPGARPMDFTGRPMVGYIFVKADSLQTDEALSSWVNQCYDFASTLSPKQPGAKKMSAKKKSA